MLVGKAQLEVPDAWQKVTIDGVAVAYRQDKRVTLAITRNEAPNPDAWSTEKKTREAYADAIERGLARAIPGYKRTRRTLATAGRVPALDLEATRDGGATVIVRVVMFRSYALTLAMAAPHGSGRTVVCGHSAQASGRIADLGHTICIDTGITKGGKLTCLELSGFDYWQASADGTIGTGRLRG